MDNLVKTCMKLYCKYREIISYLFFGVLTTLVNFASYFLLTGVFNINYIISNAIAWIVSVLFAYVTNRIFVFKSMNTGILSVLLELVLFIGCRVLSGVADMLIMILCIDVLALSDIVAKLITSFFVVVLNYIFSRIIIFRKHIDKT